MDERSLQVLELPEVLERAASFATNEMGRLACLALAPSPDPSVVIRRNQETREARYLLDHRAAMPMGGIRDIRESVERAVIGQAIPPAELLDIAQTIAAAQRLHQHLRTRAETVPVLAEITATMRIPPMIGQRVADCISDNGEIRDTASPELARIRSQRRQAHDRLIERLNAVLASERTRSYIQEPIITNREGRYCIPVKAEYRSQFGGIIHDVSASGATVFVEPGPCIELGNKLKELAIREEQEIVRILGQLSELVARHSDDLRTMLECLTHLDLIHARALFADKLGAHEPSSAPPGVIRLFSARHPLLTGDVVPIDIEIGDRFDILILTGPNTGGKTVALKTVGLFVLMHQCGLQIPASPDSSLAVFEQVYADIGDEQDIRQSLSTFSAHMRNLVRILGDAADRSLILLDEIGAGTDPTEGAALARAILSRLQSRGARVIATTHYGELKEYAYSTSRVENGTVEFNRETLLPAYRVLIGIPGSSHALYIARRLGLPEEVAREAESQIGSNEHTVTTMLEQIEASRRAAYEQEQAAAAALRDAKRYRADYERRATEISDIRRTIRSEVEDEARAVLRRTSEKAENVLAELRKMNKGSRKGAAARKKLIEIKQEAIAALTEDVAEEPVAETPVDHRFRKGDHVRVLSLSADGRILEDPAHGEAQVQVGSMRATLPVDVLRPIATPAKPIPPSSSRIATGIALKKAMHVDREIMIRAMRVEEAEQILDRYMDDAFAAGFREVRIIHGKGTGVLRKFVHEYLRTHPLVAGQRRADDADGGDGATIAVFKE